MTLQTRSSVWILSALFALMTIADAVAAVVPPVIRGAHALYLKADRGPLDLRLYKRDLNIYDGSDELIADLFSPDRRLLATLTIPDDGNATNKGGPGQIQSVAETVNCDEPGVCLLAVRPTGSGDCTFGLRTSCEGVVATGPLLLNNGDQAGRIYFQPPRGVFSITAQALHIPGVQEVGLFGANGQQMTVFNLVKAGLDQTCEFPADVGSRDGLWYLDVPHMDVKMSIKGVNFWSFESSAYFTGAQARSMLLPQRSVRYLQPGTGVVVPVTLRNPLGTSGSFALSLQCGEAITGALVEPESPVAIPGTGGRQVLINLRMPESAEPGSSYLVKLHARSLDDEEFAAVASVELRAGEAPVDKPLNLPIVLRRYEHENVQFGYAPDYQTNEVYFDRRNRPFIRNRSESLYFSTAMTFLDGDEWTVRPFNSAIEEKYGGYHGAYGGGGFLGAKVAFDGDDASYTLLRPTVPAEGGSKRSLSILLYSPDEGQSYQILELPGSSFDLEQFTGHNALDAPPPILSYVTTGTHEARFAAVNDLLLYLPTKQNGKLELGEPVVISKNCLGSCQHSGGPGSVATRDGKTHIVWGELAEKDAPGVPTYVATLDHKTRELSDKVFLGYAPPVNDVHNVPAICLDSEGYLHVVTGAHGEEFTYSRSLKPNSSSDGWTKSVPVLTAGYVSDTTDEDGDGRQTYISLVCDQQDTLHIAFRQWRMNVDEYHQGVNYAALSVQSKPKGKPWGPAQPIVVPPVPGYSIYYHKLTVDRQGWLYLSYNYWTSDTTYQDEFPERYHHQAVVVSKDGGKTWKLVQTSDFAQGVETFNTAR